MRSDLRTAADFRWMPCPGPPLLATCVRFSSAAAMSPTDDLHPNPCAPMSTINPTQLPTMTYLPRKLQRADAPHHEGRRLSVILGRQLPESTKARLTAAANACGLVVREVESEAEIESAGAFA